MVPKPLELMVNQRNTAITTLKCSEADIDGVDELCRDRGIVPKGFILHDGPSFVKFRAFVTVENRPVSKNRSDDVSILGNITNAFFVGVPSCSNRQGEPTTFFSIFKLFLHLPKPRP
jgi:hypothetical protein